MAKKRFGITFKGFDEMSEKYQSLGGNLKVVVDKCLQAVPELLNPNLQKDINKYKRRSKTNSALDTLVTNQKVEWEGTVGRIPVGFKIVPNGLPTIFFMYGTKPHTPRNQYGYTKKDTRISVKQDMQLYNDIYGTATRRKVNEKQKEIFTREIKMLMNKK